MMTSEEIDYIALAKQADVWTEKDFMFADVLNSKIEAFAKLVAAKERADEREACAKLCENFGGFKDGHSCADLIRARGEP